MVDAGVRVGDLLRGERPAGASGADREAQVAVRLDEALLDHHQRLGLQGDVAVLAVVVECCRRNGVAAAERHHVARRQPRDRWERAREVGERRCADRVRHAAAAAVGDEQLVVPLRLRRPRRPRFTGLEEGQDLVLVAVLVAGLDPDHERHGHAVVGRGHGHVRRRRARVVWLQAGRQAGRLVQVRVGRGLVALRVDSSRLALPRLDLWSREHRPAVGVVGDRDPRPARLPGTLDGEDVVALAQPGDEAFEAPALAQPEHRGDVLSVERHLYGRRRDIGRVAHRNPRVAARDEVGPVRDDLDAPARRLDVALRPGRDGDPGRQRDNDREPPALHRASLRRPAPRPQGGRQSRRSSQRSGGIGRAASATFASSSATERTPVSTHVTAGWRAGNCSAAAVSGTP